VPWGARLWVGARMVSLLYVLVLVFLVLAVVVPALVTDWRPMAVVSGSMQPAVSPGAMVLVEPASRHSYYSSPSIITFYDQSRPGHLVTHRVLDTRADQIGEVSYATKGDANRVPDSARVPHDDVIGSVRMVVPFVGLPALWANDRNVGALAAFTTSALLTLGTLAHGGRR
jgi:signal peptidase